MNEHYPRSNDEVRRHFDFFDDDNNGYIDFGEYRDMLEIMGLHVSDARASESFELIDTNADGQISFEEFFVWWDALWHAR